MCGIETKGEYPLEAVKSKTVVAGGKSNKYPTKKSLQIKVRNNRKNLFSSGPLVCIAIHNGIKAVYRNFLCHIIIKAVRCMYKQKLLD